MCNRKKKGGSLVFNKIKQFVEKILSFNIGTLFKAEIKNKIADNVEGNKLLEVNNDNSQQNFYNDNSHKNQIFYLGMSYSDVKAVVNQELS